MAGVTEWAVKPRLVSTCSPVASTVPLQHDEGVREIVAAKLARIESDLDRGEAGAGVATSSSSASSQRSGEADRFIRGSAGAPGRTLAGAGARALGPLRDGGVAAAADQTDRFGDAENHKGTGAKHGRPKPFVTQNGNPRLGTFAAE